MAVLGICFQTTVHAQSLQSCLTLRPPGLEPTRLLCPWDSPGKNTGVGSHALLQGIFLTQGLSPRLLGPLHWQAGSSATTGRNTTIATLQNGEP